MIRRRTLLAAIAAMPIARRASARRLFLRGGTASATPITSVLYGTPYLYNSQYPTKYIASDTWGPTWASDGNLYTASDDTVAGWQNATSGGRNVLFSELDGYTTSMTGTLVNSMDAWGLFTQSGSDGYVFKQMSIISVHGTLYMVMTRQSSAPVSGQFLEHDVQIIKSSDLGVTWTPAPPATAQPYTTPMWPGTFGPLVFVQYDKQDYTGQTHDGSDTFVYAMHLPVAWNNNDDLYLGRVLISAIGNLSASDWEWYQGGGKTIDDATAWGAYSTKASTLHLSATLSTTGVQWLPAFKVYLMLVWQYPTWSPTISSVLTYWDAYWAESLVGPWHLVPNSRVSWAPLGLFSPRAIPTSVVADGGKTAMMICAGDFGDSGPQGRYTLTLVPISINPPYPPPTSQSAAWFSRCGTLATPLHNAYQALIDGLVADGVWATLDALYVFATDTMANALLNLVSVSFPCTIAGTAITFAANAGFTGVNNSTTDYLDTGFNASTAGGNFSQDSATMALWSFTDVLQPNVPIGITSPSDSTQIYIPADGSANGWVNGANGTATAAPGINHSTGSFVVSRTSPVYTTLYHNGIAIATATSITSQAMPNGNFYILNRRDTAAGASGGAPYLVPAAAFASGWNGGQVAAFQNRMAAYLDAIYGSH